MLVLLSLSSAPFSAEAAKHCALAGLQMVAANHPECLFYTGTAAFRRHDYGSARTNWQAVLDLATVPPEYERLRNDCRNNLGFLYYMGKGVAPDRLRAIGYWSEAQAAGHEESTYHLCHTYGAEDEPEYDPKRALPYCREALRRYYGLDPHSDGYSEAVVSALRTYLHQLDP